MCEGGVPCCAPAYNDTDALMPTMTDIFRNQGLQNEYHYAYFLCAPSRVSILIGRFVNQADTFQDGWTCSGVGKGTRSIGELLREHGYYTSWLGKCHTGMAGNSYVPGSRGFSNTMGFFGNGIDYVSKCAQNEGGTGKGSWASNCKTIRHGQGAKAKYDVNMHIDPPRFNYYCNARGEEIVDGCLSKEECEKMKSGTYVDPWGTASIAANGGGADFYPPVCTNELLPEYQCLSAYDRYDPQYARDDGGVGGWDGNVDGGDCEIAYDWCAAVEPDLLNTHAYFPPHAQSSNRKSRHSSSGRLLQP